MTPLQRPSFGAQVRASKLPTPERLRTPLSRWARPGSSQSSKSNAPLTVGKSGHARCLEMPSRLPGALKLFRLMAQAAGSHYLSPGGYPQSLPSGYSVWSPTPGPRGRLIGVLRHSASSGATLDYLYYFTNVEVITFTTLVYLQIHVALSGANYIA